MTCRVGVIFLLISIATSTQCAVLSSTQHEFGTEPPTKDAPLHGSHTTEASRISSPVLSLKQHEFGTEPSTKDALLHGSHPTEAFPTREIFSSTTNLIMKSNKGEKADSKPPCTQGFDHDFYTAKLKENTCYDIVPVDYPIRTCRNDSTVTYSLQSLTVYRDNFWIHNMTGELHMTGHLDYEKGPHQIDLLLKEENGDGTDSGNAFVRIEIVDMNDNAPNMSQPIYNISRNENSPRGVYVLGLSATDADSGNNSKFEYILAEDCPFVVQGSGIVTLNAPLDYETRQQYVCNVYARETLTSERFKSNKSQIILNVIDVNDNSPIFTQKVYEFAMSWPLFKGEYVGQVTAYDRDSGSLGAVAYSVESPYNSYVQVENVTGYITITDPGAFPFSHKGNVSYVVLAHDGGNPSRMGQVEVRMKMVEGYKRWFFYKEAYVFSIREDALPKSEVGRVEVNSTGVNYTLSPQYQGIIPFNVTINGIINLTPSPNLDYDESDRTYFFTVEARDGETIVHVNVTIDVTDVNDNPPYFTKPSQDGEIVPISRLTKEETIIFNVTATDKDSGNNSRVTYTIPSALEGELFAIGKDSGEIRLRKSAVNIDKDEIHLTVHATDNGDRQTQISTQIIFAIGTTGTSGPPKEYLYLEITENTKVTVNSTTLLGRFEELKNDLNLTIDTGNNDSRFSLSSQLTISNLDYELHQYRELNINVTGRLSGLLVGFIHVAIKVIDTNDNRPVFISLPTYISIPMTAKPDNPVFQFIAHDKDSVKDGNGLVTYSLVRGDISVFDLDRGTGVLVLKTTVDQYKDKTFSVTVEARDRNQNSTRQQTISFTIFDPNEGYPVFNELAYFGSLPENRPLNSKVLLALPELSVHPIEHDVTVDVVGTGKIFYTLPPYGDLLTNMSLDRETTPQYALSIQSSANHPTPKVTTVFALVNVIDVNDNSPHFPFSVNRTIVSLSDPANVTVATVEAIDKDSEAKLNYKITTNPLGRFYLNQTNNTVQVIVDDPSLLPPNPTHWIELYVDDGLSIHNDTTWLLLSVDSRHIVEHRPQEKTC